MDNSNSQRCQHVSKRTGNGSVPTERLEEANWKLSQHHDTGNTDV